MWKRRAYQNNVRAGDARYVLGVLSNKNDRLERIALVLSRKERRMVKGCEERGAVENEKEKANCYILYWKSERKRVLQVLAAATLILPAVPAWHLFA